MIIFGNLSSLKVKVYVNTKGLKSLKAIDSIVTSSDFEEMHIHYESLQCFETLEANRG